MANQKINTTAKTISAATKTPVKARLLMWVLIIGLVDLVCLFVLVLLLGILPQKAEELKTLRSLNTKNSLQKTNNEIMAEIASGKIIIDKLEAFFPDENGLVKFTEQIDKLKNQGVVSYFSFASNEVVQDKTKYIGLPIIIEFQGTARQVENGLKSIQSLPYMLRTIDIEIKKQDEEKVNLRYGGILYVNENFSTD